MQPPLLRPLFHDSPSPSEADIISGSSLTKEFYKVNHFRYYPVDGFGQYVFVTDLQLPEELPKLDFALRELKSQADIINTFEAWYFDFEDFYNDNVRDLESEYYNNHGRHPDVCIVG